MAKHSTKTDKVNYRNYKSRQPKHAKKVVVGTHKPSPVASILKWVRADRRV